MSKQPEALRLADALSAAIKQVDADDDVIHVARWFVEEAAAELRRQHAENLLLASLTDKLRVAWRDEVHSLIKDKDQLEAQRDALLEKIKAVIAAEQSEGSGRGGFVNTPPTREHQRRVAQAWQELHAAIKAVEEGK